jgi:hypothetical protein
VQVNSVLHVRWKQDSVVGVVGIATTLRAVRSVVMYPTGTRYQTGSRIHPPSYSVGTGFFPWE